MQVDRHIIDFFTEVSNKTFSPLIIIDKNHKIIRANKAARQLLLKFVCPNDGECIGMQIDDVVPEIKGNNRISDGVFEVKVEGKTYYMIPFRIDKNQTDERLGLIFVDIYSNEDITSQLAYQREIAEYFEEILEGSFDGILVTDSEGKVLFVNSSYERVAEIKRTELEGKYMRDLINPIWMPESVAHLVAKSGTVVSKRQVVKSGRHIMVTGRPIFDANKKISKIVINARDITEIYNLTEELQRAKESEKKIIKRFSSPISGFDNENQHMLAISNQMQSVLILAEKVANFQATVLILGESGVGKEEVAKFIHENSIRKDKPFVVVNCGAIPNNLLESELFGYEKGSFTGAMQAGKTGLIEAAENGTIFLDEIGEIPQDIQVKLLRFLESKEIRRVGAIGSKIVDVRIISATNKNLQEMVKNGSFREDLYYRLNVVQINVPPLRKRVDDIVPLALLFLNRYNKKYNQNKKMTYEIFKAMEKYTWPGNVRELKNVIENIVILCDNEYLEPEDLPWHDKSKKNQISVYIDALASSDDLSLTEALDELEKLILVRAKEQYGATRKIAEKLKVNQSTIVRKMQKHGLE